MQTQEKINQIFNNLESNQTATFALETTNKMSLIFAGFVEIVESNNQFKCKKPAAPFKLASSKQDDWLAPSSELIDESSLLDSSDLDKPSTVCIVGATKKACKDCSCGLKEQQEVTLIEPKKEFKSSCGSCYLGDAFRCGGCPYAGMPAFKQGEQVSISLMDDI